MADLGRHSCSGRALVVLVAAAHPRRHPRGARCESTPVRGPPQRRAGSRRRACSRAPRELGRVALTRHSPAPCCSSRCDRAGTPLLGSTPAAAQWRRCIRAPGRRNGDANCRRIRSPKDRAWRTSHRPPRSATTALHHPRGPAPAQKLTPRSGQSRQGSVVQAHRCEPEDRSPRRCGLRGYAPPPVRSAQSLRAWRQRLLRRRPTYALPASHRRSCGVKRTSARGSQRCALQNDSPAQRAALADRTDLADWRRHQHLSRSPCSPRAPRANRGADLCATSCASSMPRPTRARRHDRLDLDCESRRCRRW